jgi:nucleotide-binding universal stress UspA family protein
MRNLLVPVDLSEISIAVVEQASCLAQSLTSSVWLLHVLLRAPDSVPFNLDRAMFRKEVAKELRNRRRQLHELAGQLRENRVHVITRLIPGAVNTTILAEAERINADLVIMGSHGHGNVYHTLFGGVGQNVMRKLSCPVMLVSAPKFSAGSQRAGQESRVCGEIPSQ